MFSALALVISVFDFALLHYLLGVLHFTRKIILRLGIELSSLGIVAYSIHSKDTCNSWYLLGALHFT